MSYAWLKTEQNHKKGEKSACLMFGPLQIRCFFSGWLLRWKWCNTRHESLWKKGERDHTPDMFHTEHRPHFGKSLDFLQIMDYKDNSGKKKCLECLIYLYPDHIFLKYQSTNIFCCYEHSNFAILNAFIASYQQGKSYSVHSDS